MKDVSQKFGDVLEDLYADIGPIAHRRNKIPKFYWLRDVEDMPIPSGINYKSIMMAHLHRIHDFRIRW